MAKKAASGKEGGLFGYGQNQMNKGKDLKLFPAIEDLNPGLKGKTGGRRRG